MTAAQAIVALNIAALGALMLSMGLQVPFKKTISAARPARLVGLCIAANYVLVPAIALGLLYVYHSHPMVWIGFFILATCPAAPVGPPLTKLANGNLSLALAMMVILAGLSTFFSPGLLTAYLAWAMPDSEFRVDFLAVVRTLLVAQMIPLIVGFAINHYAPHVAQRIVKPVGALANLLMVLLIGAIITVQFQTLAAISWRGWLGMALLLSGSLALGWLCGGRDRGNRIALAITTGPRNAAVGLAIATGNFAGTPVVTAVVAYGIASMVGTALFALWLRRRHSPPFSDVQSTN